MKKQILLVASCLILAMVLLSSVSALIVNSVDADDFTPGKQGSVSITLDNNGNSDIENVVLSLDLAKVPFTTVGAADESIDEIRENRKEDFTFNLRAFQNAAPGDYQVPYTISFNDSDLIRTQTGTFGLRITASPQLTYTVSTENPVVGQKGTITLKVVNKGLADAKFVSVKLSPTDFTLLSENDVYLGTISSDDFETATFDVVFTKENPILVGVVEYNDFEDNHQIKNVQIPVNVYSKEKALELGIIKRSNAMLYIIIIVVLVILFFVWRYIQKRRRVKRSMQKANGN